MKLCPSLEALAYKSRVTSNIVQWLTAHCRVLLRSNYAHKVVKTGAHISEEKARVDFRLEENISTRFPAILSEYNRIITADLPIITGFTDEETQRRFWRIPGFATVPCGGTHVRSTAEVGFVDLKRERSGKSVERIKIILKDSSPSGLGL